jgi:hypothetical protein
MKSAIELFAEFFNKQGWSYNQVSDKPVIHTDINGHNGRWHCVVVAGPQDEHVLFLSLLPCKAVPNRRAACAELLTQINSALKHGCFVMDFDDGEIGFRTSLPPAVLETSPALVEYLVFSNLCIVDRFFAAIMKVLYANVSPKAALQPATAKTTLTSRFELN